MTVDAREAYMPDAWHTVGALLRRPAGWPHWAEVVWRDPRAPRFVGDMPHTWVGSDRLRATHELFGYTDDPARWPYAASGVSVTGLVTPGGRLADTLAPAGRDGVAYAFATVPTVPPGGLLVRAPFDGDFRRAEADGASVPFADGAVVLRTPARRVPFSSD